MTTLLLFWTVNLSVPTPWVRPDQVTVYQHRKSVRAKRPWDSEKLVYTKHLDVVKKTW